MARALVLVADGSEEIETVTVIDVLRRAKVEVSVASVGDSAHVLLSRQVKLTADLCLNDLTDETDQFDTIVLPGGLNGAKAFIRDEKVQRLLKEFESSDKWIAAICASTTAIYAASIGKGKKVTSYPTFKDQLKDSYDYKETPVVVDHKLITSRGPGTAMAWSLTIIKELCGAAKAKEIADQLLIMFQFD